MSALMKADIRRVLRMKVFYICAVFMLVLIMLIGNTDGPAQEAITGAITAVSYVGAILASVPVFLGLFGEDFKAGSLQCAIGHGLSRKRLIMAKYLTGIFIILLMFLLMLPILKIKFMVFEVNLSRRQEIQVLVSVLFVALKTVGYLAFSLPLMFVCLNASLGMISDMLFILVVPTALKAAQEYFELPFYDYSFTGLLERAEALVQSSRPGWPLIWAVVYIATALLLTECVFFWKEMDF